MSEWNKKVISKVEVESLHNKYGIDAITASIFLRRNITDGNDILYFLEDDLRFQHSPFCFNSMEDAVDRIITAKEEKEKVLIFGDRDVDGVTATTVLYDFLKFWGIDVQIKLPQGNDAYGISMEAVEEFSKEYGSLIIAVDCGISNIQEIQRAGELGIDVIVADHHNAPEILPSPAIIIDPKVEDSGYPFHDISGCAVVYKLVSALRYSMTHWYKSDIALLNIEKTTDSYVISCIKIRNSVPVSRLYQEKIDPETGFMDQERLFSYLRGSLIVVWNENHIKKLLSEIFGSGTEFNLMDLQSEFAKLNPPMAEFSLGQLKHKSKIAKYGNHAPTETGGLYNLFVSFVNACIKAEHPEFTVQEEKDLQLVALAALADIMPMKNENRLFVKKGLASLNARKARPGLLELLNILNLSEKKITSTDLSWSVIPNLNAAGRMGQSELAARLFIAETLEERVELVKKITELNSKRKQLTAEAQNYAAIQAKASLAEHNNNLCVVIDERINRGVSGILAGKLVSTYNVPALAVTIVDDIAIGSMRSCRNYDSTLFLNQLSDLFLNHGGHTFAAGFSFERSKLNEFTQRVKQLSSQIELSESSSNTYEIDAEIPASYLVPEILNLTDKFEPFGEENAPLIFMSKNLPVIDAAVFNGRSNDALHLSFTIDAGKNKWPCKFWYKGELLHKEFEIGDRVDILYRVERNFMNRNESLQLSIIDLKKSESW